MGATLSACGASPSTRSERLRARWGYEAGSSALQGGVAHRGVKMEQNILDIFKSKVYPRLIECNKNNIECFVVIYKTRTGTINIAEKQGTLIEVSEVEEFVRTIKDTRDISEILLSVHNHIPSTSAIFIPTALRIYSISPRSFKEILPKMNIWLNDYPSATDFLTFGESYIEMMESGIKYNYDGVLGFKFLKYNFFEKNSFKYVLFVIDSRNFIRGKKFNYDVLADTSDIIFAENSILRKLYENIKAGDVKGIQDSLNKLNRERRNLERLIRYKHEFELGYGSLTENDVIYALYYLLNGHEISRYLGVGMSEREIISRYLELLKKEKIR